MILNCLLPIVDEKLIPEQAGFRPGRSCTRKILKLTQHIEDGFEKGMVTGAIFVDLSAAYNTINHRKLLQKLLEITKDSSMTEYTQTMLSNRRFYVILHGKRSKWRNQKNGLPQVSVLAPLLFKGRPAEISLWKRAGCQTESKALEKSIVERIVRESDLVL